MSIQGVSAFPPKGLWESPEGSVEAAGFGFHLLDATMMFAPRSGGVKRYLLAKADWLATTRPDITHTILAPGARTGQAGKGLVTISAARLPFGDGYRMPASPARWEQMIRLLDPHIIDAGDVFVPGLAALEAGQSLGRPVVGFCHTDAAALAALRLGEWARAPARRQWAEASVGFAWGGAPGRPRAARRAEAGVEGGSVQPLGVDLDLFHPGRGDRAALLRRLGLPSRTRLLVFAGRPAREKNIDAMVEAVERLGDPYRLLLVGAGRDQKPSRSVLCLDYVSDGEALAGVIAGADAFLHGNENEPFGLAVLEALAAGTPVIGPRQGGVGELIDETVGQRAERATASGRADAITALFARDVEALSAQARLRAEQRHGWAATFSGLARIYGGLVQGTVSRPRALSA